MFRVRFDFRGVSRAAIDVAASRIEVLLWGVTRRIDSASTLTHHCVLLLVQAELAR